MDTADSDFPQKQVFAGISLTLDPAPDYVALIGVTRITAPWKDSLVPKATEMFCVIWSCVWTQRYLRFMLLFLDSREDLKGQFNPKSKKHFSSI